MSDFNLDRFAVLVVDDNAQIQRLLRQSLYALGIGEVRTANHGGQAIDLLTRVQEAPQAIGVQAFDFVVADWQMAPLDGIALLQWIRHDTGSPDRYLPFLLVTGYADAERIDEARDAGVNEILGKPFSVASLAERVCQLIERPRQFVQTARYFGPDRRRRAMKWQDRFERRQLPKDAIEVVYDYA